MTPRWRLSALPRLFVALATVPALVAGQTLGRERLPSLRPLTRQEGVPRQATRAERLEPGSQFTVYLVTAGQGDAIWEKFGHTAIWIHDSVSGSDVAYNWGIFDFAQPGFIRRFLQGHMIYWMAPFNDPRMIRQYIAANRSLWVQRLHLSPTQRNTLHDFVAWNAREENKYYRYDYYRDNCSTRVRDVFD